MILWVHGFLKPWNKNFPALGLSSILKRTAFKESAAINPFHKKWNKNVQLTRYNN